MKKRLLLSVLLCITLAFSMLAACSGSDDPAPPPDDGNQGGGGTGEAKPIYVLDFADGKTDFVFVNTAASISDKDTSVSVKQADGANALAISAPNTGTSCIAFNIDGLLGDKATDIKTIIFDVYAAYPDGTLRAVGGEIRAISGDNFNGFASAKWTVYIENRNPNQAVLELGQSFSSTEPNILEFRCVDNGPAARGETPAEIYIKSITFFNDSGNALSISTDAGWAAPEGYGVAAANFDLPAPSPDIDRTFYNYTTGSDSGDIYLPWQTLQLSAGITFEIERTNDTPLIFIHMGAYNNWGWTELKEEEGTIALENNTLTIMWNDFGIDFSSLHEDDSGAQFRIGNWTDLPIIHYAALIMG